MLNAHLAIPHAPHSEGGCEYFQLGTCDSKEKHSKSILKFAFTFRFKFKLVAAGCAADAAPDGHAGGGDHIT